MQTPHGMQRFAGSESAKCQRLPKDPAVVHMIRTWSVRICTCDKPSSKDTVHPVSGRTMPKLYTICEGGRIIQTQEAAAANKLDERLCQGLHGSEQINLV